MVLIYWWVRDYPVSDAAEEAHVGRDTAINVYQWLREVCTIKLLSMPIQLGGPGKVVQIDESLFKHKPKVQYTREQKYYIDNNHNVIILIGSQRTPTQPSSVGVRDGRYFSHSSSWLHADSAPERCCHSTTDHTTACSKRLNCVVRRVGSI